MHDLQQLMMGMKAASNETPSGIVDLDDAAIEEWAYASGLVVWIWGLPLLRFEQFRRLMSLLDAPAENLPYAPIGQLGHMRSLPTWESVMPFTPNVDTLYSGSICELDHAPAVFIAPAMPDRYWSLEIADAFLANQPYLGTRTTGTDAGAWLLVAPDWDGEVPEGLTLYRSRSSSVMLALRIHIEGESDTPEVVRAQHGFRLTTIEGFLDGSHRPAPKMEPVLAPPVDHDIAYFTTLCELLDRNPPQAGDGSVVALLGHLGLEPGRRIDPDAIRPPVRRGLARAAAEGPRIIGWKVKHRGRKNATMWNVDLVGGSYGDDHLARAEGAIQGLFVHDPEECIYFHTYHSGDGELLDGSSTYTLHFDATQLARVHPFGFWSITGYDPKFTLVRNDAHRYAVQSGDGDLNFDPDGGLTIVIGPDRPAQHEANWIATCPGELFRLNYRIYLPTDEMLDIDRIDRFLPPVVRR